METRLVSADSHVMEPPDLWLKAIGHRFGDRTPQVNQLPGRPGHWFVMPGVAPYQVAHGFGLGKGGKELREHLKKAMRRRGPAVGIRRPGSPIRTSIMSPPRSCTRRLGCRCSRWMTPICNGPALRLTTTGWRSSLHTVPAVYTRSR